MDIRRVTIHFTVQVDPRRASWDAFFDTVDWHMGQLQHGLNGLKGISRARGEVVYEGNAQGVDDAPEASNAMGESE